MGLEDDFSGFRRDSLCSLRLPGISSIGRRASLIPNINNTKNESIEQQKEHRKQSREYRKNQIKEMDQMYHDKNKLNQRQTMNIEKEIERTPTNKQKNKSKGSEIICKEFSECHGNLSAVINNYKQNIDEIKEFHKKQHQEPRQKQNEILLQQLQIMQNKIDRQQQKERDIAKRRELDLRKMQQQKQRENEIKQKQIEQKQNEQKQQII